MGRIRKTFPGPDQDSIARDTKWTCCLENLSPSAIRSRRRNLHQIDGFVRDTESQQASLIGGVYDGRGTLCWQLGLRRKALIPTWRNPFGTKDFVVTDIQTDEEMILCRDSFLPSRFVLRHSQGTMGTIRLTSILRNRYTIDVDGRQRWVFRMPLFARQYWGETADGVPGFWIIVGPSTRVWNVLIGPEVENPSAMAAVLSFIHYQWQSCG